MNKSFNIGIATAAFCMLIPAPAQASDETLTETRQIDARVVRIKLDGVVDLKVRQGATPALTISGDKRWLSQTTTHQSGDTLSIDTEVRGFKGRNQLGLRAELTLPNLRGVTSESVGFTEITGFTGDDLELVLDGAGSMKVISNYRTVSATLGGVGSMNIQAGNSSEGIDLNLRGAGYVTLTGRSKWLKASLGGLGGLDAQHFQCDTVDLELSGLGNATVSARQNANLNLSGLGSVTVYGKPLNRSVSVDGLGKVSWK